MAQVPEELKRLPKADLPDSTEPLAPQAPASQPVAEKQVRALLPGLPLRPELLLPVLRRLPVLLGLGRRLKRPPPVNFPQLRLLNSPSQ